MAEYTEEEVDGFTKKVGERIQQVREFRGMTRRAFGEAMGLKGESANTGVYALEVNGGATRLDTIYKAARILDVDRRVGSVERGKDADLLLLDGRPLQGATRVVRVISAGRVVLNPEN